VVGLTIEQLARRIRTNQRTTALILQDLEECGWAAHDVDDRWHLIGLGVSLGQAALDGLRPLEADGEPLEPRAHKTGQRQDVPGFSRLEARERSSSGTIAA
jgi:DNA-binding IclR family transcriptional regulator